MRTRKPCPYVHRPEGLGLLLHQPVHHQQKHCCPASPRQYILITAHANDSLLNRHQHLRDSIMRVLAATLLHNVLTIQLHTAFAGLPF